MLKFVHRAQISVLCKILAQKRKTPGAYHSEGLDILQDYPIL